eukprot:COSAG01_NODE_2380_length_7793_cov_118.038602_7_plen_297_part_00
MAGTAAAAVPPAAAVAAAAAAAAQTALVSRDELLQPVYVALDAGMGAVAGLHSGGDPQTAEWGAETLAKQHAYVRGKHRALIGAAIEEGVRALAAQWAATQRAIGAAEAASLEGLSDSVEAERAAVADRTTRAAAAAKVQAAIAREEAQAALAESYRGAAEETAHKAEAARQACVVCMTRWLVHWLLLGSLPNHRHACCMGLWRWCGHVFPRAAGCVHGRALEAARQRGDEARRALRERYARQLVVRAEWIAPPNPRFVHWLGLLRRCLPPLLPWACQTCCHVNQSRPGHLGIGPF